MHIVRTPEDRFAGLPDFGYPPRYAEVDGLRLAYVQAGPPDGEPVLLLHGEPSWSFLYRHVIAVLAAAGLRAIAAGLSDRPNPIRSGAIARKPASASTGITVRYRNDQLGSPCSSRTGSPSAGPVSM